MSPSITVKITLTPALHQKALDHLGRRATGASLFLAYFLAWVMSTFFARWLLSLDWMKTCSMPQQLGVAGAAMAVLIGFFAYQARKAAAKLETLEMTFIFSEHGVEKRTLHSESKLEWKAYQKFSESGPFYFLYYSNQLADLVPKEAFASPEEEASFRELLARQVSSGKDPHPVRTGIGKLVLVLIIFFAILFVSLARHYGSKPRSGGQNRETPADSLKDNR